MNQRFVWDSLSAIWYGKNWGLSCSRIRSNFKGLLTSDIRALLFIFFFPFLQEIAVRRLPVSAMLSSCTAALLSPWGSPAANKIKGIQPRQPQLGALSLQPSSTPEKAEIGLPNTYTWKNTSLPLIAAGFYRNQKESVLLLKFFP